MANNPRVPCIMEGARRPDREGTWSPTGLSVAVGDVMTLCGVGDAGPGDGAADAIGDVTITGPTQCNVGFSAQFAAGWTGGIDADTVTFAINGGSTATANLTTATDNPVEVNFTAAGNLILDVTVVAAAATDTPQTGTLTIVVQ